MSDHDEHQQMVTDCENRESRMRAYKREFARQWRAKHPEKTIASAVKWQKENPEKVRAARIAYRAANLERLKETAARYRAENREKNAARVKAWKDSNRARVCEYEKRRELVKASRVPPWASVEAIAAIYVRCAEVSKETGVLHHVDHIIPLKGAAVSGLHVETNLQIITATENMKKYNKMEERSRALSDKQAETLDTIWNRAT